MATTKTAERPIPILIRVFEHTGRIYIPGSDYGGRAQDVRAAVHIHRATGWEPCPFSWHVVRAPDTGDLVVDLAWDVALGFVALYPATPKPVRKKRARKKAVPKAK